MCVMRVLSVCYAVFKFLATYIGYAMKCSSSLLGLDGEVLGAWSDKHVCDARDSRSG